MNPPGGALLIPALLLSLISCGDPATSASGRDPDSMSDAAPSIEQARVVIDASAHRHRVDPRIFGMHIEWVENGLGLLEPRSGRLRSEVVELILPLGIPLFRFPGGIHADYYDWRLGIGPPGTRKTSSNVFNGADEEHRFGTREFIDLLTATGAEALITANVGTGTSEDAGDWAAYLRDQGSPVGLWEVGNETYLTDPEGDQPNGRRIYRAPEDYASDFPRFRKAIRKATPKAMVGAIAHLDSGAFPLAPASNSDWSETMLRALNGKADFIAVHNAYAPVILDNSVNFDRPKERRDAYRSMYAAAEQTAENLDGVAEMVDTLSPANKGVPIAVTEFGPFFGLSGDPKVHADYVDQTRTLAAALYTGSILHVLMDNPRVMMACYTNPIHRWYGGLLTDTDDGLVTTPTHHLYSMYRTRFERQLVASTVTSPGFSARRIGIVNPHENVRDLLVQTAVSEDGRRLTAMLINRSVDHQLETTISIGGFRPVSADCQILTAPSPAAINGPPVSSSTVSGSPVSPKTIPCAAGPEIKLEIPPNSVVSLVAGSGVETSLQTPAVPEHPEGAE